MLNGKIFITGGAGYLARAIYRRAERDSWPCEFTAYSRHEDLQTRLHQRFPQVRRILGDVRDRDRLATAMAGHDVVIHAAALKRVPEAEENVCETVDINVDGSMNVAHAARRARVQMVIGVSTDKSSGPLNLYGATKMVMERIFCEADGWHGPRFIVTRYGNVVGSTGSIVPMFRDQLARSGRVRVTDPEMTRFWLAPDDAVDLILDCATLASTMGGSILIPRPGAMKIGDLAALIAGEAPIDIVGPRPGEKVHESLINEYESHRGHSLLCGETERIVLVSRQCEDFDPSDHVAPYSSDAPDWWIKPEQMEAMIADAANI